MCNLDIFFSGLSVSFFGFRTIRKLTFPFQPFCTRDLRLSSEGSFIDGYEILILVIKPLRSIHNLNRSFFFFSPGLRKTCVGLSISLTALKYHCIKPKIVLLVV